jgi:hypothetical protein
MTNWVTLLGAASNITTIVNSLVASWRAGSALAITAYDDIHLRTLVNRLLDEGYILRKVLYPDNYPHLSDENREWVKTTMDRYALTPSVCSMVSHCRSI